MIVSSPIGDLPFEPRNLHYRRLGFDMDGVMGAWPAQVRIEARDLPALLRLVAKPSLAFTAAAAIAVVIGGTTLVRHQTTHPYRRSTR